MDTELFDNLEKGVDSLLTEYRLLKQENELLKEENLKLQLQRNGVRDRLDAILKKLDGIELRLAHYIESGCLAGIYRLRALQAVILSEKLSHL